MIKYLFALGFLLIGSYAFSQITITQQHLPSAGDTVRYSVANSSLQTDFQTSGANYQWDFTNLQPSGQELYEFKSSLQTPYILSFGFTAIGLKIADTLGTGQLQLQNVYNFFKKSSSAYEAVGLGFQYSALPLPQSGKHSDPERIYALPLNYADKDTDRYALTISLSFSGFPIGSLIQSGTRYTEVDGWGTISTPYGDDIPCLRVVSTIDAYDSISIPSFGISRGLSNQRVEYKWLSTSEKIPILEINGTWAGRTFIPTFIRYRDIYRDMGSPLRVNADFIADKTLASLGDTIRFTNTSTGQNLSYRWEFSPASAVQFVEGTTGSDENPAVVFDQIALYNVKLVASNFIASDSLIRSNYLDIRSSIPGSVDGQTSSSLRIAQNPAEGSIRILGLGMDESVTYALTALSGKIIEQGILEPGGTLRASGYAPGLYYLRLFQSGQNMVFKIIVN